MTLEARFSLSRGPFTLDVDLTVTEGEVIAIMGANGSGKTTLVNAIAGLLPVGTGRISLDDRVLDDADSDVFVDPADRSVGVVFQSGLLFHTMSVRENICFGLRARGIRRDEALDAIGPVVERLNLGDLLDRRPRQLSGGQAQRAAIARALVTRPRVLLLDEPMSGLDATTRQTVRDDFRNELDGFAGYRLIVTHDPLDVTAMADRVIVLDAGRVVWDGSVDDPEWRNR